MSCTLIWKKKKLGQEWIFLRYRRPKLANLGHFRSIIKNFRKFNFFWAISLQNPTQAIFYIMQKKFCPLLLPLQTIFGFNFAHFWSKYKNCRKCKFFWAISLQNQTKGIFDVMKNIVSPLLLPLYMILGIKRSGILVECPNWEIFLVDTITYFKAINFFDQTTDRSFCAPFNLMGWVCISRL